MQRAVQATPLMPGTDETLSFLSTGRPTWAGPTEATQSNAGQVHEGDTVASLPAVALAAAVARLWRRLPYLTVKRVKVFLTSVTCLLVVASATTSYFITQRQSALKQASHYNLAWVASVAPVEITRFEAAVLASMLPGSGVDQDQVQLRLDIVKNRVDLFSNAEFGDFVQKHPDLEAILTNLRSMTEEAQLLIEDLTHEATVIRLFKLTSPLGPQLVRLAAAANAHNADLVARDQALLSRLHTIFSIIIAGLTVCGFGLLGVVTSHNRLLGRSHAEVNALVQSLQERDRNLNIQNGRFDAALNNMSQALCMVDQQQRVIVCNVRFLELFGISADMVRSGTLIEDVFCDAAAASRYEQKIVEAIYVKQRELIAAGRTDSFLKENLVGQAVAVSHQLMSGNGWVATYEDVSERRKAEARIHFMAHHDALTCLPNRLLFEERLGLTLKGMRREDGGAAVLCLDLDRFKDVNDSLGHPAGDQLLKEVAGRLLGCVRDKDVVARLGGDEFAILQSSACQPEHAEALARRLIKALGAPFDINGTRVIVGTSVGVAIATGDGNDVNHLLKNADIALYKAKGNGRGTHCLFEVEMDRQLQARRAMELDLRQAIDRAELEMFYQPLFDLRVNKVTGFEALLRWYHPVLGMVSPVQFIPIAEEIGMIATIGKWVLNRACQDATKWPDDIKVAVNLSPVQFQSDGLVRAVRSALDASGLPPRRLELEITESALLNDSNKVLRMLHELRDLGVEIALDDFGTGYSSLSYLRSFPFDKIKIDQSFVRELSRRTDCLAIVQSVVQLAQKLGMTTTAEGVETLEQLDQVRETGCTQAQGYYFDRPKPASELAQWFTRSSRQLETAI